MYRTSAKSPAKLGISFPSLLRSHVKFIVSLSKSVSVRQAKRLPVLLSDFLLTDCLTCDSTAVPSTCVWATSPGPCLYCQSSPYESKYYLIFPPVNRKYGLLWWAIQFITRDWFLSLVSTIVSPAMYMLCFQLFCNLSAWKYLFVLLYGRGI